MDDLSRRIDDVRPHVRLEWEDDHVALLLVGTLRRRRRRQALRVAGAVLAIVALVAVVALGGTDLLRDGLPSNDTPIALAPVTAPPADRTVWFEDGSSAIPADARTELWIREVSSVRTLVVLDRGEARFDVTHAPSREFVVLAGPVRVRVLGTRFTVARHGERTAVKVSRGRVAVTWPGGETELAAGMDGVFPWESTSGRDGGMDQRVDRPTPPRTEPTPPRRAVRTKAIATVEPNDPPAETRASETATASPAATDRVGVHLAASDAARAARRPEEALEHLTAIWDLDPTDPRAPLAAFTAGRLLVGLARSEEAARAFRRARDLNPDGALAEDAWAREVEANVAARRLEDARRLAADYLAAHPEGRHAERLRRIR